MIFETIPEDGNEPEYRVGMSAAASALVDARRAATADDTVLMVDLGMSFLHLLKRVSCLPSPAYLYAASTFLFPDFTC
jgi:hypothetical protein